MKTDHELYHTNVKNVYLQIFTPPQVALINGCILNQLQNCIMKNTEVQTVAYCSSIVNVMCGVCIM